jgi:hypothetical protein
MASRSSAVAFGSARAAQSNPLANPPPCAQKATPPTAPERPSPGHRPELIQWGLLLRSVQGLRRRVGRGSAIWSPKAQFPGVVYRRRDGWWRLSPLFDEGAQNFKGIQLSILALSGFVAGRMRACLPRQLVTNGTIFLLRRYVLANVPFVIWRPCPSAHHSSVGYAQVGGVEEFSGIAGVVLLVENVRRKRSKRTKSWGDPLSPLFHEGAQNFNLSILPCGRLVSRLRRRSWSRGRLVLETGIGDGWGDGGPNKSARNAP